MREKSALLHILPSQELAYLTPYSLSKISVFSLTQILESVIRMMHVKTQFRAIGPNDSGVDPSLLSGYILLTTTMA